MKEQSTSLLKPDQIFKKMVYLPHWPCPSTIGGKKIDYETVFERMSAILNKMGNPEKKLPPTIHIAGTNGKGSAAALLTQIYIEAGFKVHCYTSPHLHDINERIILNGEKISDNYLFYILEQVRIKLDQEDGEIPLTFMEIITIAAFLSFSEVRADILIMECGMGGRIDATNIIEEKLACLITTISYDHTEYLGNSIERIALEKAMIMRKKTPLIISNQTDAANKIIKILADDQKIRSFFYPDDYQIFIAEESKNFDILTADYQIENIEKPALLGSHQYYNFSSAIVAAMSVRDKFYISEKNIKDAVRNVKWPSRLEKIENKLVKLFKNTESEIWLDGAHNEEGARVISNWLLEFKNDKKNFVICGFSRNKCKAEFLEKFRNIAEIYAVKVDGEPYPEEAEIIKKIAASINLEIFICEDLLHSLKLISEKIGNDRARILICGSLHLARDVKKFSKF
jgi:dihydrofolate synthase/folylpolyglutamate synthase